MAGDAFSVEVLPSRRGGNRLHCLCAKPRFRGVRCGELRYGHRLRLGLPAGAANGTCWNRKLSDLLREDAAPAKELAERAESLRNDARREMAGKHCEVGSDGSLVAKYFSTRRSEATWRPLGPAANVPSDRRWSTSTKVVIASRRIDLSSDQVEFLSAALPHELTHVILRDRFVSAPPPLGGRRDGDARRHGGEARPSSQGLDGCTGGRHDISRGKSVGDGRLSAGRPIWRVLWRECVANKIPGRSSDSATVCRLRRTSQPSRVTTLRCNPAMESTELASSTASGDKA